MEKKHFIYMETFGCSSNTAESQIIAGLLSRSGHEIVKNPDNSDLIILNTCAVKSTTVNKILFRIMDLRKNYPEKPIAITGCLTYAEREKIDAIDNVSVFGNVGKSIDVESIISGNFNEKQRDDRLCLPKIRENEVIDIVPICTGCSSACTFCVTKIAKGSIFSYSQDNIISEITSAKKFGAKEFWLTGQDVSAYGMDIHEKSSLPALLDNITESVGGKYFIRVGMLNPRHVIEISNELLKSYKSGNIFKFLHLPVQSGSDRILKKMNRMHTTEDFVDIVEKFRRHYPLITVWTDMITGFPGETEEDFLLSMKLLEKTRPDFVNISMFSSHHKAPASKMKQTSTEVKKERSRKMTELVSRLCAESNGRWIGWKGEVLVDEYKKERGSFIGRNFAYKPIVIRGIKKDSLGKFIDVEIKEARQSCLVAEPL